MGHSNINIGEENVSKYLIYLTQLCVCMCVCVCVCAQSCLFFEILWTVIHLAPLSVGFSRYEYWFGFPFPPPGDLPDPGTELASLLAPVLAG